LNPCVGTVAIAHNDVPAYYAPLQHYAPFIDCAVGVSSEIYRQIVRGAGIPEPRSTQIPYGVEGLSLEEARHRWSMNPPPESPLRIGFVGRIAHSQKRVLDFVPLVAVLQRRWLPFELHLIGDGPDRDTLQRELRRAGLERHVRFWGWQSQSAVREHLRALDVFLLMSDHEGLPVALLEAMGHAVVPVASRIPSGNPEVVEDGRNGFLVPVGDIGGFADRIERLARDVALLARMRRAAWETASHYTVPIMIERYAECFARLADPAFPRDHRPPAGPFPVMGSCRSRYPRWLRKLKYLIAARLSRGSVPQRALGENDVRTPSAGELR